MKSAVVCQPVSKFVMFTVVISYTVPFIVSFPLNRGTNKNFGFLVAEQKRGRQFSKEDGAIHTWMKRCYTVKEDLITEVFHLTHKENIEKTKGSIKKKTREAISPL